MGMQLRPRPMPYPGQVIGLWWCPVCGHPAHRRYQPGRARVYCTNACRQRAYRWRCRMGIRVRHSPGHEAERALTYDKRHALRNPVDFVAGLTNFRDREVAVCGAYARPARLGRWTHHHFVPDHPWSCASCVRLIDIDD